MASEGVLAVWIQEQVEGTVRPLLETRQYDQAAELLHDACRQAKQAQLDALASILLAGHQICRICEYCWREGQHQQNAYQETLQRETELQQLLFQLLSEPATTFAGPKPFDTPATIQATPPLQTIELVAKASWWQSLKAWMARSSHIKELEPAPTPLEDDSREAQQETVVEPTLDVIPQVEARADADSATETPVEPASHVAVPPVADLVADDKAAESIVTEVAPETAAEPAPYIAYLPETVPEMDDKADDPTRVVDRPSLIAYCLGNFRLYEGNQLINNWSSRKGKQVLKYLLLHRQYPVSKEILMETFWPGSDPEAARNNLNVAIYGLRQALRNGFPHFSHVVFQDESYGLNPELVVWVDVEEFQQLLNAAKTAVRRGSTLQAVHEFEAAAAHYQGELLAEDRYEEWLLPMRQRLHDDYLNALDYVSNFYFEQNDNRACIAICREMLVIEPAYEAIHRRLMRAYARQNQHYLALRQYQQCVESLRSELDVAPDPKTTQLFEKILRRDYNDSN